VKKLRAAHENRPKTVNLSDSGGYFCKIFPLRGAGPHPPLFGMGGGGGDAPIFGILMHFRGEHLYFSGSVSVEPRGRSGAPARTCRPLPWRCVAPMTP
jgi:hypothetical protein